MKKEMSILKRIYTFFQNTELEFSDYKVPKVWVDPYAEGGILSIDFKNFYKERIKFILSFDKDKNYAQSISQLKNEHHGIGGDWSYKSIVYNAFPRFTTAFDHQQSGDLDNFEIGDKTFRKSGTFLKMIALLPYIKSLGVNTLHMMPITKIGNDGNRGDLGSPYAIKNPLSLDENLAESAIPFSVEEQFGALVEACHLLDIRVVLEFVLRTASLDSDWVKTYPERFYWIQETAKENYHSPVFSQEQLKDIKQIPAGKGEYHSPNKSYQNIFKNAPAPKDIYLEDGKYKANSPEGTLIIPGAFADWPPDDKQPPWDDVTYLRMYDDEKLEQNFNYIAYNTIRYYDPDLASPANRLDSLWNDLENIIPYYQENFGIDGVMLDMGHALPKELLQNIIRRAREIDSDFGFWEENFVISSVSRFNGFNAALGFEWKHRAHESGLRNIIRFASKPLPLPFLGTSETHNTPRKTIVCEKKQWWIINSFLPSCLPFIHNGFELNEKHPVNTGLNFSEESLKEYADYPLPLFYRQAMDWDVDTSMIRFIQKIGRLRAKNEEWIATGDERTLTIHYPENRFGHVLAFERHDAFQPWKSILVIMNTNGDDSEQFFLELRGTYNNVYNEYLTGDLYTFEEHWLQGKLDPGQSLVFEMHKLI